MGGSRSAFEPAVFPDLQGPETAARRLSQWSDDPHGSCRRALRAEPLVRPQFGFGGRLLPSGRGVPLHLAGEGREAERLARRAGFEEEFAAVLAEPSVDRRLEPP